MSLMPKVSDSKTLRAVSAFDGGPDGVVYVWIGAVGRTLGRLDRPADASVLSCRPLAPAFGGVAVILRAQKLHI